MFERKVFMFIKMFKLFLLLMISIVIEACTCSHVISKLTDIEGAKIRQTFYLYERFNETILTKSFYE